MAVQRSQCDICNKCDCSSNSLESTTRAWKPCKDAETPSGVPRRTLSSPEWNLYDRGSRSLQWPCSDALKARIQSLRSPNPESPPHPSLRSRQRPGGSELGRTLRTRVVRFLDVAAFWVTRWNFQLLHEAGTADGRFRSIGRPFGLRDLGLLAFKA